MGGQATGSVHAPAPAPGAVLELLKPITWFPPMWAFMCGVVSSGVALSGNWLVIAAGIALAGPLVCATSQAANDWFDRHVDAINEPNRPIPSGRIPGRWGLYIAIAWTMLSLALAAALGTWVLAAAVVGLILAWVYSAPPLRLKQNGWWGNTAVAACYEGLPWITGAAVMVGGAMPDWRVFVLAALYSAGAHGIMTLNDFKSVEGDLRMGVGSIPARTRGHPGLRHHGTAPGGGDRFPLVVGTRALGPRRRRRSGQPARADAAAAERPPRQGRLVQRHGHHAVRLRHDDQRLRAARPGTRAVKPLG